MTAHQDAAPPLEERLAGLAAFLTLFQSPTFEFSRSRGGEKPGDGSTAMPYIPLSDEAVAFVDAAYRLGWVLKNFDWPTWKGTPEALRLRDDPKAMAKATPEQLAALLTVLIRLDRFLEGSLAAAFESGLVVSIVARASSLLEESSV